MTNAELNANIAGKMGLSEVTVRGYGDQQHATYRIHDQGEVRWITTPDYAHDIAAAFTVVERLRQAGWLLILKDYGKTYDAIFYREKRDKTVHAEATTIPEAICQTAAKVPAELWEPITGETK